MNAEELKAFLLHMRENAFANRDEALESGDENAVAYVDGMLAAFKDALTALWWDNTENGRSALARVTAKRDQHSGPFGAGYRNTCEDFARIG